MTRKMTINTTVVLLGVMICLTLMGEATHKHLSNVMKAVIQLVIRAKHTCGQPGDYKKRLGTN